MIAKNKPMAIGLLKLTDAAPVIMAKERGYFAEEGIEVELSIEPSWATLADRLAYGLLDAAVMLPPLVFATSLGLRGAARPLVVPLSLSLGGNTVTLATSLAQAIGERNREGTTLGASKAFARLLAEHRIEKPVLAVVHAFSSHHFLLRYWLAAGGIDPDRDIAFSVIPPAQTVDVLADCRIDGFCAGAPWGALAAQRGIGATVATSHQIWSNGPEKVFAVPSAWAEANPERLRAILRALFRAARYCDQPENAETVASVLARADYLALPPELIRASLPSVAPLSQSSASVFYRHAASFPWHSHALWFLSQMMRWGYLPAEANLDSIATSIYRPDLYAAAAREIGISIPMISRKREGEHETAWRLEAEPAPIAMGPDRFCDGAVFDPDRPMVLNKPASA